jgi:hypothetical protein
LSTLLFLFGVLFLPRTGCEQNTVVPFVFYPPSRPVPTVFFGLHIHQAGGATPWPPFPVFAWRLWDAEVSWNFLQPQRNEWNSKLLDRYVDLATQHNAEIALTLGYTPRWAASRPDEVSSSGMPGVASPPADLGAWREYVRTIATRYKGKIHVYEIWNEANLSGYFSGTLREMVMLAKEAFTILKEVDSTNIVISPAVQGGGWNVNWLDDFLSLGGGNYCDVIGYHFYVSPKPPEAMLNVIDEVREALKRHGINKPVWNTESGWSMEKAFADDDERSGYVARAYLIAWAGGIERFYWYAYDNYTWTSLPLTLPDRRNLNAAGKAYAVLQSWLINSRIRSCTRDVGHFWTCIVSRPNGSTAWIVWAGAEPDVRPAPDGCCRNMEVRYLDGRFELRGQSKSIPVGPAPVLIEEKTKTDDQTKRRSLPCFPIR